MLLLVVLFPTHMNMSRVDHFLMFAARLSKLIPDTTLNWNLLHMWKNLMLQIFTTRRKRSALCSNNSSLAAWLRVCDTYFSSSFAAFSVDNTSTILVRDPPPFSSANVHNTCSPSRIVKGLNLQVQQWPSRITAARFILVNNDLWNRELSFQNTLRQTYLY